MIWTPEDAELMQIYVEAWAADRAAQPFSLKRALITWTIGLVFLHAMIVGVLNLVQMIWG